MNIGIRVASPEDVRILKSLASKLVPSSFNGVLNTSQIDYMMDKYYSQQALQDAIDSGTTYFIANLNGEDVACGSIIKQGPDLYLMQKIFVESKVQGRGIGTAVFERIKAYVKDEHPEPCTIELIINKHNPGLPFYNKLGLVKVRDTALDMGDFFIGEEVRAIEI